MELGGEVSETRPCRFEALPWLKRVTGTGEIPVLVLVYSGNYIWILIDLNFINECVINLFLKNEIFNIQPVKPP
jgi:hypothetical protein